MDNRFWRILVLCALLAGIGGCEREERQRIRLGETGTAAEAPVPEEAVVRIAVGGMITPREGMGYYRDFLKYIQAKIGSRVVYVDREDYAEINEMLRTGQLEAAFVCSGPYVDGKRQFGLEFLAAPQAYGETVYYSYIIVPANSPARSLADLRGKRFAFTDPLSNSGKLVPTYMLARMGEQPETFFAETIFTRSHDRSIRAVAQGIVDGAAVDSLIWEYLQATNPEHTARTRILLKSPPYGIPPVVVPPGLDPVLKEKLREVVLNAHADPEGQKILRRMKIDRFVTVDDSLYDSVREMQAWLAQPQAGNRQGAP